MPATAHSVEAFPRPVTRTTSTRASITSGKQTARASKPTNAFVGYTIEASDHYPVITDFILTSTTDHSTGFYFPFNEGTGTTVTDSIGGLSPTRPQHRHGIPIRPAVSPEIPRSFRWRPTKITVPDPKQIIGPNPFNDDYTLQAWVKLPLNYAPSARAIMFQYERDPGFSFSINTNRTLHTTTFKIKDIASTAAIPNDGAWHHVAVVHTDGVNMKFYIDGALAATVAYTNGAGYRVSSEINIGADPAGANWFTGYLDRIRFDNRALTPAELDSSAGTAKPFARTPSLVRRATHPRRKSSTPKPNPTDASPSRGPPSAANVTGSNPRPAPPVPSPTSPAMPQRKPIPLQTATVHPILHRPTRFTRQRALLSHPSRSISARHLEREMIFHVAARDGRVLVSRHVVQLWSEFRLLIHAAISALARFNRSISFAVANGSSRSSTSGLSMFC